ncbi:MAG: glycoside hydrolase family 28 protein [Pyrinomonadaceae bacterium]|nr:glycoside hydrolase family 28 protein [Sphingobacteriaceae bacterium]
MGIVVSVENYGAKPDGKTVNTQSIQRAIDYCSKSGGGKVRFPSGNWVSGTILLKDGVTLLMEEKATLLGSENIADYYIVDGFKDGTGQEMGYCFIGAIDVKNTGIEGKGTIDGRGKLVLASGGRNRRPFLIRFVRSNNIKVIGVNLRSSAAWTMHIFRCKDVKVEGLTINSRGLSNNDGIDIDCCQNVKISDCDISSGDDAICFKTTSPYPCKNIQIKNIRAYTNCAAIKMGTESAGNFEDITISNIEVVRAGLGAIKLLSVDGSNMRNITISDIKGDSVNVPIMIRLGARLKTFRPEDKKQPVGTINNITIKNVAIKNGTTTGILISGIPNHYIKGINFENISISLNGGGTTEDAKIKLEEKIADYPEVRMFGKSIPTYGMYVRHASNLVFKNISITTKNPDARPAIIASDIENLTLTKWSLPESTSTEPVLHLTSARNVLIKDITLPKKPQLFINVEGKDSKAISVNSIYASDENTIKFGTDVPAIELKRF